MVGIFDDISVRVCFDGAHEVEIVADGSLVGADLSPLVSDQVDALGGSEAGFHAGHESRVDAGRVGAAVIAVAPGVGKEEAGGGRLQCGIGGGEELTVLTLNSIFETDGEGPFLRGVRLNAGAEEEAFLRDRNSPPRAARPLPAGA